MKKQVTMKRICLLFLALSIMLPAQAEVYKYINAQGKVAYGDEKRDGAVKVVIPPVPTYPSSEPISSESNDDEEQETADHVDYEVLEITSPLPNSTIRRDQLDGVKVEYLLRSALQAGDRMVLYINGEEREGMDLGDLERGGHILQLEVLSDADVLQIASTEVSFTVQQVSRLLSPAFRNNATVN
ncbi:MAG: hypothetical protein A6F71_04615 [Cycloclasticus sp. symbiont of Poecilosclerida sp. M]|nr:MAG: hypothetical protein A6F71_04615 [Cycloclasticus sp. symbiont of Poecilosclerida sp. M]